MSITLVVLVSLADWGHSLRLQGLILIAHLSGSNTKMYADLTFQLGEVANPALRGALGSSRTASEALLGSSVMSRRGFGQLVKSFRCRNVQSSLRLVIVRYNERRMAMPCYLSFYSGKLGPANGCGRALISKCGIPRNWAGCAGFAASVALPSPRPAARAGCSLP